MSIPQLPSVLVQWKTLLGDQPRLGTEHEGRELWPVTATDGRSYFLKRLGRWRNLPVADQARILAYLSGCGLSVAPFMITDGADLFAGEVEDSFVLIPELRSEQLNADEVMAIEPSIGRAVAELHSALAAYPWPANSYREQVVESLAGDVRLPGDVGDAFTRHRGMIIDSLAVLPLQLVHGDLTPENILLSRSGPPGFIDFDHLPMAPRVWDIGKYLGRRFRGGSPAEGIQHLTRFLAGYGEVTPLTEAEIAAVPAATIAANVLEIDWTQRIVSGELDRRLLPGQEEDLRITADTLRWQLERLSELMDAVRGRSR